MGFSTMGKPSRSDEAILALVAAIFKQAAQDYRFAVIWMMKHPDKECTRKYKTIRNLRNEVVRFTKSDMFELVLGDQIDSKTFLKMALKGQVCEI